MSLASCHVTSAIVLPPSESSCLAAPRCVAGRDRTGHRARSSEVSLTAALATIAGSPRTLAGLSAGISHTVRDIYLGGIALPGMGGCLQVCATGCPSEVA